MPFALVYENFADKGVLAGGGWSLGLANLQDPDIGLPARSASAAPADTQFTVNLGSIKPVGALVLGPINLTPGSSYRFRAYADAGMTGTPIVDTGIQVITGNMVNWLNPATWLPWEDPNFWTGITPSDSTELPQFLIHLLPVGSPQTQFWKIELSDPASVSGAISIGRLLMGRLYRPSMNYAYEGNDFGIEPLMDITESLGGSETFWERGLRRTFRAAWPLLPETEVFDTWIRIALRAQMSRQVFVIPEESDSFETMRRRAFLARFKSTPRIAQAVWQRAATSIDMQEIL